MVAFNPGKANGSFTSAKILLNFAPLLYYTVNFGLIDVKQTQQESCVSQLSAETRPIYL